MNGGRSRVVQSPHVPDGPHFTENTSMDSTDDTIETASVGADGRVCFYGKTSLYHIASKDHCTDDTNVPEYQTSTEDQSPDITSISPSYFRCHNTAALLAEISPALLNDLLDTYWCYPHHLHCVLCKPLFIRQYIYIPSLTYLIALTKHCRRPVHIWTMHHPFSVMRCTGTSRSSK